MFQVKLVVRPRAGIRDPQGEAVEGSLKGIGFTDIQVHAVGRFLHFNVDAASKDLAREQVQKMCEKLLVNPNLEDYDMDIDEVT